MILSNINIQGDMFMTQFFKVNFQPLYRVAQFLALAMLLIIPLQIAIYIISPPPGTVKGFFELYRLILF